jgi:hypothetical protein
MVLHDSRGAEKATAPKEVKINKRKQEKTRRESTHVFIKLGRFHVLVNEANKCTDSFWTRTLIILVAVSKLFLFERSWFDLLICLQCYDGICGSM